MLSDDSKVTFLIRRWGTGESMLPVVRRLIEIGENDKAAAAARLALALDDCLDREGLEKALDETAQHPEGWMDLLEDFARNPSEERWQGLMQFVPEEISTSACATR